MSIKTYLYIFLISLTSSVSGLALKPEYEYHTTPGQIAGIHRWEEININVTTDISLHTWIIYPKQSADKHTIIIYANTDTGNKASNLLAASNLANAGYTIVLFDYRGYGNSSPYFIDESFLYLDEFTEDLQAVFKYATNTFPKFRKGVFGVSMGTIISQISIYKNLIMPDFMIYDRLVVNPSTLKNKLYGINKKHLSMPTSAYTYVKDIESIKVPSLIFADPNDAVHPIYEIEKYVNKRRKSTIARISKNQMPTSGHSLDRSETTEWIQHIEQFLLNLKQQ